MTARRGVCGLLALLVPLPALAVVPTQDNPIAVVRALDKVTARVAELELPVGRSVPFGNLTILARACRTTLPEEAPPEAAAFLAITETRPEAQTSVMAPVTVPVFSGWMFASSPALSAMEHPVYDIWLTGCKDNRPPQAAAPLGSSVVAPSATPAAKPAATK